MIQVFLSLGLKQQNFSLLQNFQRQVHERLTQLELLNNQYRRLARENRTDRAGQLKARIREGNERWDALQHRGAAVLRRLKVGAPVLVLRLTLFFY